MLPARNRKDFDEIPDSTRQQLEFVWLEQVDQAVASALEAEGQGRNSSTDEPPKRRADARR
jgi:ATP-dependent Lon protease